MISIIVAKASNNVIGSNGSIPWHISNDFKHFKEITTGHTIVMGMNTLKSLPESKPLPNRRNIVLTSQYIDIPGAEVIHNISELDTLITPDEEVFIIGGSSLYKQFIHIADKLYVTDIQKEFDGDTYFPEIDSYEYVLILFDLVEDSSVDFKYFFKEYSRIRS